MEINLERKTVIRRRRFTSGHRTVGGKRKTTIIMKEQVMYFVRIRKMEEGMADER